MTTQAVRSPLKWIGGKYAAAARIVGAFPSPDQYETYLEPCGGAAHVLLYKPPWGHREIYNDLNDDLYNFWVQVQEHAEALVQRLRMLPYSRRLYYEYYTRLFDGSEIEPRERAVMWFYVLRSTGTGWLRPSPVGWNNHYSNALSYRTTLEMFQQVQARIVQPRLIIENRDIEYVLTKYDSPTTLHYIDPPYIGAEYYYQVGARKQVSKPFDHRRLAELLGRVQGFVALSYYPSADLDSWYPADRWRRLVWHQHKPSAIAKGVGAGMQQATEMLLCNYPASVTSPSLWNISKEEVPSGYDQ